MLRTLLIATFVACAAIVPASAKAQQVCGDRAKIVAHLDSDYKEGRSGIGLAASGTVIELFTAKSGTWTMLMTAPDGRTCVMGTGEGWEQTQRPKPVAGEIS